jgi:hypothetical protein
MGWVDVDETYQVSLAGGKVLCRTGAGKVLKSVPAALKEAPAVVQLRQVREWLGRHDAACLREVGDWMIRSLPVPVAVLAAVWPDASWQSALRDLVVAPVDPDGAWRLADGGFLRDAGADGLGVVNLDGDSVRLATARVVIPHPVLLDDLDELREFAVDLGVSQGVLQLFREMWRKPEGHDERLAVVAAYEGGYYEQIRHVTTRALSHGYTARGGIVSQRIWERGAIVDATIWVGEGDPSMETEIGALRFVDRAGGAIDYADLGPVAWSEGVRMAATLHAGQAQRSVAA